jgi:membrane peptidoglycan carboxypeptidase
MAGGPGAPRRSPASEATDLLPPVHEEFQREPELMTHREHDLPPGADDYIEPDEYLADEEEERRLKKKRIWRRVRRTCYVLAAVGFIGPMVAFIIAYFVLDPPNPQALIAAQNQTMTVYYSDGSVMATIGPKDAGSRTIVTIDKIPKAVQHAVEAAEDPSFETNKGFDIKGIARAVLGQFTGGGSGGSGITQQYIKNATGDDSYTYTRKFTELVKSIKMNQQQSKDEILEAYLNTVYFGRGAYGIQAASQAYFHKDVKDLDLSQAIFIAGAINKPSWNEDPTFTAGRYDLVTGRMLENGWMTQADKTQYPKPPKLEKDTGGGGDLPGSRNFILKQVLNEVEDSDVTSDPTMTQAGLQKKGAKIYTTIDPKAQAQAEDAARKVMEKNKMFPNLATALVAINPSNGEIMSWYGGDDPQTWSYDQADTANQPGSSFKPFVFIAAMKNNPSVGLSTTYNGEDKQTIAGRLVRNSDGESCGKQCTVKTAMTESVNTVFYQMTDDARPDSVRDTAIAAGIKDKQVLVGQTVDALKPYDASTKTSGPTADGIGLGQYEVRPRDMAMGYATIANDGMRIQSHFIRTIVSGAGSGIYDAKANPKMVPKQAFDVSNADHNTQLARNATAAMLDVAKTSCNGPGQTHCNNLEGDRPVASKTGTAGFIGADGVDRNENSNAWMVGFTPQVVTAVWVGNRNGLDKIRGNYYNQKGGAATASNYTIFGREEPSYIWKGFMDSYLKGKQVMRFSSFTPLGTPPTTTAAPTTTTAPTLTTTPDTTTTEPDPTTTTKHKPTTDPCIPFGCPTTTPTTTKTRGGGDPVQGG